METILIEVTNQKAMKLLHELEELHLIRVLKKGIASRSKLSEKYAGRLPADIAEQMQQYVDQGRREWDNI